VIELQPSPTELTTAATDLLLAIGCLFAAWRLLRTEHGDVYRGRLWATVFALIGLASLLGTVAHGLVLPESLADAIWHPLYLALGLSVALILVGALLDACGKAVARRWLGPALAVGVAAFMATQALDGAFIVFVAYEGVATIVALALYARLALQHAQPGAVLVAAGLALNLVAAAVQASDLSLRLIWAFDHNGLFHLVLFLALALLYIGIEQGQAHTRDVSHVEDRETIG